MEIDADRKERESPSDAGDLRLEVAAAIERSRSLEFGASKRTRPPFDGWATERESRVIAASELVVSRALRASNDVTAYVYASVDGTICRRWSRDTRLLHAMDGVYSAPGFVFSEEFVGVNGVGSVIETRKPIVVTNNDHVLPDFAAFTCVGSPVRDPWGKFQGVLCGVHYGHDFRSTPRDLLLASTQQLSDFIRERLFDDSTIRLRLMMQQFLSAKQGRGGVAIVGKDFVLGDRKVLALLVPPADDVLDEVRANGTLGEVHQVQVNLDESTIAVRLECIEFDGERYVAVFAPKSLRDRATLDSAEKGTARAPAGDGKSQGAANPGGSRSLAALESQLIEEALIRHNGNVSAVARELRISRTTVYRKAKLV